MISPKIAQALFVAIATDTGWFHFRNTDTDVFRCCAELIDIGVDSTQIYGRLYLNFSPQRFKLLSAMLNTLQLHFDGRFATQFLTQKDFETTGASFKDTENLIDECRRIGSVQAAALFVESPDGRIKCSLRSTGPIDVRIIAEKFGGGGHKNAAGAHIEGSLEEAKRLIFEEIAEQFTQIDSK